MTPDGVLLHDIGIGILEDLVEFTTISVLYGVFIWLFCVSTYTTIHQGLRLRSSWIMLTLTATSFALATIYWAAYLAGLVILIRSTLVDNIAVQLGVKIDLSNAYAYRAGITADWASFFLPIISDTVVIWRAWVLFSRQRWVMILPLLLLLSTIGTTFAYLGITSNIISAVSTSAGDEALLNNMFCAFLGLSIATNATVTLLITWKLWNFRKFIKKLGQGKRRSLVQNVLVLLVESGVIFFFVQLANLLLSLLPFVQSRDSAFNFAGQVFLASYVEFSAMYPGIIVVIVNKHRSFMDACDMPATERAHDPESSQNIGHLSFAIPATETLGINVQWSNHSSRGK